MPYIKPEDRFIESGLLCRHAGDLNFVLTQACVEYLSDHQLCYQTLNDIMGALEGAKQEFYRRVVVPYEEAKRAENGDVYP